MGFSDNNKCRILPASSSDHKYRTPLQPEWNFLVKLYERRMQFKIRPRHRAGEKPNSSHPKQINSCPHKDDMGCGEQMTNNPCEHYSMSLCSCQCHHATVWLFQRHGDKHHVSSAEPRKRHNGGNVRYSCWITERKPCNELKAQQWLIQIQPLCSQNVLNQL